LTGAPVRTSIRRVRKWFALFAASIVAVAACGARSELRVAPVSAHTDAGPEPIDAGPDTADAPLDVAEEPDVIDPFPDVGVVDCQDAGITYIYVITDSNELVRFYPPDLSFTSIGTIECPDTNGTPYSMAVDRQGVAYVVFSDGQLFRVSTLTASCKATGFVPQQNGFPPTFGMGFSSNAGDPGETLFVSGLADADAGTNAQLASIDTSTFELTNLGHFSQPIGDPELTGTKDARLFGFGPGVPDTHLSEIEKSTAEVKSDVLLQLGQSQQSAWAFAFWGGDFYFFTQNDQGITIVNRYTPGGPTQVPVVTTADGLIIVGAGVSTCAPSE
jgi:hypothetical protein